MKWKVLMIAVAVLGSFAWFRVATNDVPCPDTDPAWCAGWQVRHAFLGGETPTPLTAAVPATQDGAQLDFRDPFEDDGSGIEAHANPCGAGFRSVGSSCFKICPDGFHAIGAGSDQCAKDIPLFVGRGFFGGCPSGYVDHPVDPDQCALPAVSDRMMHPRR